MPEPLAAQRLSLLLPLFPDGAYSLQTNKDVGPVPKTVGQRGSGDGEEHSDCIHLEWPTKAIHLGEGNPSKFSSRQSHSSRMRIPLLQQFF